MQSPSEVPPFGDTELAELQECTFGYFLNEANVDNGMVPDSTKQEAAASIAAIGFALTVYPVAVTRGYLTRAAAVERTLATLRFFWNSEQSTSPEATGHRGFYYHFLDMRTGQRAGGCELSTIDSSFLFAGMLTAAMFFDRTTEAEGEIRTLSHALYERADWRWAQNGGLTVAHGWKPDTGFIEYRWEGYSEALILYVLGLGSPTHPLPAESYAAWTRTYEWRQLYGIECLYAGPLFIHQLSHQWIDFRGIQDDYMHARSIDYFENSRRFTYIQQAYAVHNPKRFAGYGEYAWGITASDGPGPARRTIEGVERTFFDYRARGVPSGPDDGTLSPWAVVASLPFAPEIVLPSLAHFNRAFPEMTSEYGFKCSYNPTFPGDKASSSKGWVASGYYGLDQGPVVTMIENHRSGFLWRLMRGCPVIQLGLRRAGFAGGWL